MSQEVPGTLARMFRSLIAKRKARTPLAYLRRKAFFWNEVLEVGPGCLIPRPETEILVEKFIEHSGFKKGSSFSFLDLGTGCGAIGIALLRHFSQAKGTFVDLSLEALRVTQNNLKRYRLLNRAEVIHSDLFSALSQRKWDAIVCNPPYLSNADWKHIQLEILFEPREALDGGQDGLDFYRRILRHSPDCLKDYGCLALEVGMGQAEIVSQWLRQKRFQGIQCFKDHAGIHRVIIAQALLGR
jgi:release factor glutamine methyltransferase